jgi:GR25 family glycosyltransferase involved in LPS biosynthesis
LRGIKDIHVINLKSEPGRLEAFQQRSGLKHGQFHRFEVIDHRALSVQPFVKKLIDKLFSKNIFQSDTRIIARALNHYTLWRHIATTTNELHLIFEDSAEFVENGWTTKWNKAYFPDLPGNTLVASIYVLRLKHSLILYR